MNSNYYRPTWLGNETSIIDVPPPPRDYHEQAASSLINHQFGNIAQRGRTRGAFNNAQNGIFSDPGEDYESIRNSTFRDSGLARNPRSWSRQPSVESKVSQGNTLFESSGQSFPLHQYSNQPYNSFHHKNLATHFSDNDVRNQDLAYERQDPFRLANPLLRHHHSQRKDYSDYLDKKLLRWSLCDTSNSRATDKLYVDCESPPEPEPIFSNSQIHIPISETSIFHNNNQGFWNNPFMRVSTNPLSRWRNRIRKKYQSNEILDNENSILKTLRASSNKSMLKSKPTSLLIQRLAIKEFERNRFVARVDIDEFRLLVSSLKSFIKRPERDKALPMQRSQGLSGILCIQVIGAMGLQSNQSLLRDLYCVIEVDNVRKARTLIKTNTECFVWEEEFEIEITSMNNLSILLYQWNHMNQHRLCFYGNLDAKKIFPLTSGNVNVNNNIENYSKVSYQRPYSSSAYSDIETHSNYTSLTDLISHRQSYSRSMNRFDDEFKYERIALQLEPNGIIYLELSYFPLSIAYLRVHSSPSANYNIPLFGSPLKVILSREKSKIPFVILKCIQEIDARGLNICGIYKICGSLKLKMQLRNAFELFFYPINDDIDPHDASDSNDIDLSPGNVPDIHVITAVLKDFLRELPEPLLTDGLYKMLLEAVKIKDNNANPKFTSSSSVSNKTKLIYRILECIPVENQRIFFIILDHLKKVLMQSHLNKLSIVAMGDIFGPLLFYPSPNFAAKMDPAWLQPSLITEMFCTVMSIWPGQKKFLAKSSMMNSHPEKSSDMLQHSLDRKGNSHFSTLNDYERLKKRTSGQNRRQLYKQASEQEASSRYDRNNRNWFSKYSYDDDHPIQRDND